MVNDVTAVFCAPLGHSPVKITVVYQNVDGEPGERTFLVSIDLIDEAYYRDRILAEVEAHETEKPFFIRNLYARLVAPTAPSPELQLVYERSFDRESWESVSYTCDPIVADDSYYKNCILDHIAQDIRRRGC